MSKFLVVQHVGQNVVGVADAETDAITLVRDGIETYGDDPEDYTVYQISGAFSYVPPTDQGQLVRKDS